MARRPCLDCPALSAPGDNRCPHHRAALDRAKWSRNANRDPAYRKVRAAVAANLPINCALCHEPITHSGHDSQALTLDHIVPVADGGSNAPSNLRPTHKSCNSSRGRR